SSRPRARPPATRSTASGRPPDALRIEPSPPSAGPLTCGRVSATPDLSAEGEYTVDEVARLTGTTVRTIRWYQSEGLLPSPRRSGRVAIYDGEHVARLESIRDLQAHGLTLTAIRRLLDRAPGSAAPTALAFIKTAVAQSVGEQAEIVPEAEGAARLGLAPGMRAGAALS